MRAVFFCNDVFGLGHLHRSVTLARALTTRVSDATALVVTGAPVCVTRGLPAGVDVVRLPSPGRAAPNVDEATPAPPLQGLRAALSLATVAALEPDIALVDHRPLGRDEDLVPALRWCRRAGSVIALGLRDLDDDPARLRATWSARTLRLVGELYDLAVVYGQSADGDIRIRGLREAGVPVRHTDLVAAPVIGPGPPDLPADYLLITAGGGIDGFELIDAVLTALQTIDPPVATVIVTGPMIAAEQLARVRERARRARHTQVHEYRSDMAAVMAGARAVVAMSGYSTVGEVIASGKPALLAPRTSSHAEQRNRARQWAAAGRVELVEAADREPVRLSRAISRLLTRPSAPPIQPDGAGETVALLLDAAHRRSAPTAGG